MSPLPTKSSKDSKMLVEETKSDRAMDAKYKRSTSAKNELSNDKINAHARYRVPSPRSCHDLCKQGHHNESGLETKADPSVRKVMLRTQSERKYVGEVATTVESSKKTAFKRLSLPEMGFERQTRLPTKEIKKPVNGVVKGEEKKPVVHSSAPCKSKPPSKRLVTTKAKECCESKAKEKKAEQRRSEEKGSSSTWKKKFKKATAMVLSSGSSSPKKLIVRRPKSENEDQNGEVEREESANGSPKKIDLTRLESESEDQNVEVEREESENGSPRKPTFTSPEGENEDRHDEVDEDEKRVLKEVEVEEEESENGGETSEVVILQSHETMEKKEENVVKETELELMLRRKYMVKALVGAFEALISGGDRGRLMAASAS